MKKLLALLFLLCAVNAQAVTYQASGNGTANNQVSCTASITVASGATAGSFAILQVADTTAPTSVTWNGVSMGAAVQTLTAAGDKGYLYGILSPAAGTYNVVVTWAVGKFAQCIAMSVTGSDTGTVFTSSNTSSASGNQSLTVTSGAGDIVFFFLGHHPNDNGQTADGAQNVVQTSTNGNITAIGSWVTGGASSTTATYTFGSSNAGMMLGGSFKNAGPAVSGPSGAIVQGSSTALTGVNFGASQGAGGVSCGIAGHATPQTITGWSATSITITVDKGNTNYGVTWPCTVTVNGGSTASWSGITSLTPPSGRSYVNIVTPLVDATKRLTATSTDIAAGGQIEYGSASATVLSSGAFKILQSGFPFTASYWDPVAINWGTAGTQSYTAPVVTGTPAAFGFFR